MKSKELDESDPWRERNFVLVLDDGEEAFEAITRFAEEQKVGGASLTCGFRINGTSIPVNPGQSFH
ncbi:hypothetical protein ACDY97_22520, partial [Rhizobium mongolense]